jgi:PAS domain S-box-containing protein
MRFESQGFNHNRHMSVLSEDNLRAFVENIQVGVILIDAETHVIVDVNAKAAEMIGCDRDKILGNECHEFICPAKHGQCPITDLGMEVDNSERIMLTWNGKSIPILKTVKRIEIDGHSYLLDSFVDLRQYKATQSALQNSEERFKAVFNFARDGIIKINNEGNIVLWNNAAEKIFGYKSEEMEGKNLHQIIVPGRFHNAHNKGFMNFQKTGQGAAVGQTLELVGIHKDGREIPVELSLSSVKINEEWHAIGIVRDITGRKQAEHQIEERIKELNAFFNLSQITEREGLTLDDLYLELAHSLPQSWQHSEIACSRIVIGDREFRTENFAESPWVQTAPVKIKASTVGRIDVGYLEKMPDEAEGPFLKEERQLINAIAERVGHIIERRQMEDHLQKSEQKYRLLSDNAADVIWVLDIQTRKFTYFSPSVQKLRGYTPEEAMALPMDRTLTLESFKNAMNELKKGLDEEKIPGIDPNRVHVLQLEEICKDGSTIFVEAKVKILRGENGQPTGIIGSSRDITARKRAEAELLTAKSFLDSVINAIADPVFVKDDKRKFVLVNDALCNIVGRPRDALLGEDGDDMFPKDQVKVFQEMDAAVLDTGVENVNEESLSNLSSGEKSTIVTRKTLYIDPMGKRYLVGVIRDITERKKAEMKIKESEKMYRDLFEKANEGLLMMGLDGHLADVNQAFAVMHGYEIDELKQMDIGKLDVLKDKTMEDHADVMNRINVGEVVRFEVEHYHKDGHIFPISVTASLIHINGQNYYLAFHQDITERRKVEVAMRESEERFRAIFENTKDGILVSNTNGEFLFSNPAMSEMLGYTPEEIKTLRVQDIHPQKDLPMVIDVFSKVVREEIKTAHELPMLRKDGSVIYVNISGNSIILNREPCMVGVFRDITERRKVELALSRIMSKLEMKNKELEDYTYTVSHDLKAPLVTIQGFSDLLAQNYNEKLDDKGRHYIDRINQGSERLNRLISDLLELSRAGRKLKPFQWHEFNEILNDSLESLEGKITAEKIKVTHPGNFPKIYGDDMRLSQVLNNLVGNAVNYMDDQKSPEISIGWGESGDYFRFWVQDNGIGIKPEDQGRIFNIFERASEQGAEGSGIGLSIVKKIVETHGGEISVESVFGEGSKFIFTIPKKGVIE